MTQTSSQTTTGLSGFMKKKYLENKLAGAYKTTSIGVESGSLDGGFLSKPVNLDLNQRRLEQKQKYLKRKELATKSLERKKADRDGGSSSSSNGEIEDDEENMRLPTDY